MKKILPVILLVMLTLPAEIVFSQGVDVLHFMRLNPFSMYSDPTAETIYKGYVAVLPISNLGVDVYNDALRYKDVFNVDNEGYPVSIDGNRIADKLKNRNSLTFDLNTELLGFGFKCKNVFVTFDWRIRANMDLFYSKDLLAFPINGNMHYLGEEHPADMNMQVGLNAYQEISFSIRQKLKEKFTWGIRPKLLFGVANVRVSDLGVQVMTDEDDYTLRMNGNLSANVATSLPLLLSLDKTGMLCQFDWENLVVSDFFKNVGAAVDLGFRYEILKGLSVSASVMDLGGIFWKTSPKLIQGGLTDNGRYFDNGGILFDGITEQDIAMLRDENARQGLVDSLMGYVDLSTEQMSGYFSMLPTRMMLQGDYEINKNHRVSAVLQGRVVNKKFIPSATFAYDLNISRFVDICVAYTLQRNCYDNVAFGLGLNLGPLNLYAGTNNVVSWIDYRNWSRASAYVGLVVNWGHLKKPTE